ncbi:MAG: hypothetical protein AUF79_05405 [Crenarchaeota archaeon 13_1_20CM_2_51_8]|nr:MAG: hypothetical protein AUF79_05405 [Crenarchaeota archaeon 13_1_20CM_2_51_8]
MSIRKSVVATIVVLAIVAIAAYGLFSLGGGNMRGGDESGFRSLSVRTVVTLAVVGGSAFITGFGLRDVIGRTMAMRQRNRLKSAQGQKRP